MGVPVLILGASGTGKTYSLRVDPKKVAAALKTEHELPGVLAGLLEGAK